MHARSVPSAPEPLGLTLQDGGAHVAVYSRHATAIDLCIFDDAGVSELARVRLPERSGDAFHGFVDGIVAGTRYGLRAHGPWDPRAGHRFNAAKLLVDPYARALDRPFAYDPALSGATADPLIADPRDTAVLVPKAVATKTSEPALAARPRIPWADTVIYELHVKGFTRLHPDVPEAIRGTCAGLAHPAAIGHLVRLGVTTVELMPIAATIDERHLWQRGLTNYWGYNPVAWCVPDPRLAPGGIAELRQTVDALHRAGLEVVLDVVLNHSGEGDALGPTLSLRGLDNATYYRLVPGDAACYVDDAGTGNTLALERPGPMRLALDALRYYAKYAGVDGFRLDLAVTLARRDGAFDPRAPLLREIAEDLLLRELKFIAEPWDVGPDGYRLGAFPDSWSEWNDRYRDDVRRFWRGEPARVGRLATRLVGSADAFGAPGRRPSCSVNFVTAHDGFTLADLVSHAAKHNEANGEGNRDGADVNWSWNCGAEGASSNPEVIAARKRDVRSLLATLLLSRGTPMLAMGDELGRTQQGNNNAYAHDDALTWLDWQRADDELIGFVAALIALRRRHRAFREDRWLEGTPRDATGLLDVEWRRPDGQPMMTEDWTRGDAHALVVALYSTTGVDADRVVIACNAGHVAEPVVWPAPRPGYEWRAALDASEAPARDPPAAIAPRAVVALVEERSQRSSRSTGIDATALDELAAATGIEPLWYDIAGTRHDVTPDTKRSLLAAMGLGVASIADARDCLRSLVAIPRATSALPAPARAWLPEALAAGERRFGLAAQLYALRRSGDQGIGDFSTLALAGVATARAGGALVGINPLHALFPADRERASPYHPSDRRFLDPIYIDVMRVHDIERAQAARAAAQPAFAALAARSDVDYTGVWQAKLSVLSACFAAFGERSRADPLVIEFERFCADGGGALQSFARFEAIAAAHPGVPWQRWPARLRQPENAEVRAFAARDPRAVRFVSYLQWLADRQLGDAACTARAAGLDLGLYRDLAVGAAPDGAETWSQPGAFAAGAWIGAPPDPFAAAGQNWGLPPPIPHAMARDGYAAFRALVAANMRHAGALRIDHVMALHRLFWIPEGATARDGAYVRYPFEQLLDVVARESVAARCLIVGEDLGTVPDGLRARLAEANVLSYRVAWFERDDTGFIDPARYPPHAAACVTTHDLPTIAGWWSGVDITERYALGLGGALEEAAALQARGGDKTLLANAAERAGIAARSLLDPDRAPDAEVIAAIHAFASAARAALFLVRAEDLALESASTNLPGTDRERANWRRKLAVGTADLWTSPTGMRTLAACAKRRRPAGTAG